MNLDLITDKIQQIRNKRVILDMDLAVLYQVETRVLKQAVRRNLERFPEDFMFELTTEEYQSLRSQIVILNKSQGAHSKYCPFAFTEQGIAMLSSVLKSPIAIQVNIQIMRVFVSLREYALNYRELSEKIREVEDTCNQQFDNIFEALNFLLKQEPQNETVENRRRIGYGQS